MQREKDEVSEQAFRTIGESAADQRRLHKKEMEEAAKHAAKLNTDLETAKARMRSLKESQEKLEQVRPTCIRKAAQLSGDFGQSNRMLKRTR